MRWSMHSSRVSLTVVGVLLVLLVALASLQYRWIAQLSDAERARLQAGLDEAAASFCEDFDKEIARAFEVFRSESNDEEDLPRMLADRLNQWRSTARWPELVKEMFILRFHETDGLILLCFDEQLQTLRACDWQEDLRQIRRSLSEPGPGVPILDGHLPGLVLAIQEHDRAAGHPPIQWRAPRDHLVIRFDLSFITETLLPELAEAHFGFSGDHPYLLSVTSDHRARETIFQSAAGASSRAKKADATARFFGLRTFVDRSRPSPGGPRALRPPPPRRDRERRTVDPARGIPPPEMRARGEEGRWLLAIRHPLGSLEEVVAEARQRNMLISLAMLVMLGVITVLMLLSTRKARHLARQQMDFVAAVSHELRTPLTAIRSAGQNLADGIIDEPERVRSYGLLIEREGRRLTEMIGRVLSFAGIRSGRQINRMKPVALDEIVSASLKDCSWVLEEKGFEVDSVIADELPPVQGDRAALQQVVTNLIDNALKYAASGRWLGVEVGFEPSSGHDEVRISVSDRGPGIAKNELSRIFEPFERGSDAAGSSIPGSGLGLAVVRGIVAAHGGSIDVVSPPGGGARFTVRLPVSSGSAVTRGKR